MCRMPKPRGTSSTCPSVSPPRYLGRHQVQPLPGQRVPERRERCGLSQPPIKAKQAAGKKVLISIGGANGQVQLTTTAARDAFVSSVSAIIDRYGLDGLDIDFEGHSLYLNAGDTDFRNPTTPVIVNLISALKTLKAKYGAKFVLTMAPETFFVQVGYQFYGGVKRRRQPDRFVPAGHPRAARLADRAACPGLQLGSGDGAGQPVPHHGRRRFPHRDDRHDQGRLPGRRTPVRPSRDSGRTRSRSGSRRPSAQGTATPPPQPFTKRSTALVKGQNCGGYSLRGGSSPSFRGLMTWSINWDHYYNWEFQNSHAPYLAALP